MSEKISLLLVDDQQQLREGMRIIIDVEEDLTVIGETGNGQEAIDLYAQHGVQEYWIVDPHAKSITVFVRGQNRFEVAGIYGEDQTLRSPTLSHFSIALRELF